ncbi:MAG: hypothetical protein ACXQTS_00095 [Candidatus Methanospirareceae archaeon]
MKRNRSHPLSRGDLVICVGGGFFGSKAAKVAKDRDAKIIIIDKDERCASRELCDEVIDASDFDISTIDASNGAVLLIGDGVGVLRVILKNTIPKLIVPAIPGHLMGRLVKEWLKWEGIEVKEDGSLLEEVSSGIPRRLILWKSEEEGVIISSYMPEGKTCKLGCVQPKRCPVTNIDKPAKMYELIRFALASSPIKHFRVLISHQMDGVGAIKGEDVAEALRYFENTLKPGDLFAITTSCTCHAILNIFKVHP